MFLKIMSIFTMLWRKLMTEKKITKSFNILDLLRDEISRYVAEYEDRPQQIEMGSSVYRRFAMYQASIQPKVQFDNIPVLLNWQIDAESIMLTGDI
jgi:hypothetical protein